MASIVDISEVLNMINVPSPTQFERGLVQECIRHAEGAVKRYLHYDPVQKTRTEFYPQFDVSLQNRDFVWEATSEQAFMRRLAETATNELQIKHIPIRTITSVRVDYDGRGGTKDGSFGSDTEWEEGTDFYRNMDGFDSEGDGYCSDGILRAEGTWPSTPGCVKIVYSAGYTEKEFRGEDDILDASPIHDAVIDEAIRRVKKAASRFKKTASGLAPGLLTYENLGNYAYTVDVKSMRAMVSGSHDLFPETREKLDDFVNWGVSLHS